MALAVETDDAGWPDHDVVDVRTVLADLHCVEHPPAITEFVQFSADLRLTTGADAPGALLGLDAQCTGDEIPDRRQHVHLLALGSSGGAGDVECEVAALTGDDVLLRRRFNGTTQHRRPWRVLPRRRTVRSGPTGEALLQLSLGAGDLGNDRLVGGDGAFLAQDCPKCVEAFGYESVPHPESALLTSDEPGIDQDLHVMADRWL